MPERNTPAAPAPDDNEFELEPVFPVRGYVLLNLIFWAFCALEIFVIRLWLKDVQGVIFFFALLALGFVIVSIYDAIYDRLRARARLQQIRSE